MKKKRPPADVRTAVALEEIAQSIDRLTEAVQKMMTVMDVLLTQLMPEAAEEVEDKS